MGRTQEAAAIRLQQERDATVRDQKLRQQVVETEPEIRALKVQLEAGYTRQLQAMQISEHDQQAVQRQEDVEQTKRLQQTQRDEWARDDVENSRKGHTMQKLYQEDLDDQLAEQEEVKRREFEQFMKDKQMIDDIVAQIHSEDSNQRQQVLDQKQSTQRDIEMHMTMKAQFERDLAQRLAEEEAQMRKEAADIEHRRISLKQKKAADQAATEALQATMGQAQLEILKEREENSNLLQTLYQEEHELSLMQKEEAEREKASYRRVEMKKDYDTAAYLKMKQREQDMEEELAFRSAMLEKFARDDKLEQLSNQRRRQLGISHGREVERLIEERRERIAHEREQAALEYAQQKKLEARRRDIIEEERQKLIKEHAVRLLGYIPKVKTSTLLMRFPVAVHCCFEGVPVWLHRMLGRPGMWDAWLRTARVFSLNDCPFFFILLPSTERHPTTRPRARLLA